MKTSSAKAKGRKLQNEVRENLLMAFKSLQEGDIKTAVMGEGGRDLIFSPKAEEKIVFDIEVKNQEKMNIWKSLEQAEKNTSVFANRVPLLVFSRNRSKTYCALDFVTLLSLIGGYKG